MQNITLRTTFNRVKDLLERLNDNVSLPLEILSEDDHDSCSIGVQVRNSIFFLSELDQAIENLEQQVMTPQGGLQAIAASSNPAGL